MYRTLSYLTDAALDVLLSMALRIARRSECGYDEYGSWHGELPNVVSEVMFEYRQRHVRLAVQRRK